MSEFSVRPAGASVPAIDGGQHGEEEAEEGLLSNMRAACTAPAIGGM